MLFPKRLLNYVIAHKILSALVAVALIGGFLAYRHAHASSEETRYVLGTVEKKTIVSTVSGSGQVSSANRVDIHAKASGDLTAILVHDGSSVKAGQAIAYVDASAAQKAVRDAEANLQSAKLSYQKLTQAADPLTLTQAQNAAESAKSNLANDYDGAFNDISDTFLDIPAVMTSLSSLLFSYTSALGGSTQQNIDFYRNAIETYDTSGRGSMYAKDAQSKFDEAKKEFDATFDAYKTTSRTADEETIEALLAQTYGMTQHISDAVKAANNLVQLYQDTYTSRNLSPNTTSNTHLSSLNSFTGTVNSHLAALSGSVNSIKADKQKIQESEQSLEKIKAGADPLDIQSSALSLSQRENALADAKAALADYTVRAPFAGVVGNVTAHAGDSVGSGVAIASIVGTQQIAELSVNEIDAAKIQQGQKATLTFDAIEGFSIAGTVADVNPIGAVSQGVVTYDIRIAFDTSDPRVKPGMTVNATIQIAAHQDALSVPSSAVKNQGGQSLVQVFDPPLPPQEWQEVSASQQTPTSVPVEVGISDDTSTEILSGLSEGQQIVVRVSGASASASVPPAGGARGGFGATRGAAIRF